jgi:hypothetical protein
MLWWLLRIEKRLLRIEKTTATDVDLQNGSSNDGRRRCSLGQEATVDEPDLLLLLLLLMLLLVV